MAEEKKAQIILLDRWRINFEMLSDEQTAQIVRAMYNYQHDGIEPNFTDKLVIFFWQDVKQWLDDSKKRYQDICDKNRKNIQEFWDNKKANTDEYERIQSNTNATNDNANDNAEANEIDNEQERDNQTSESSDAGAEDKTDDTPHYYYKILGDYYEELFQGRPHCNYAVWKKYVKHFGSIEAVKQIMDEIKDIGGEDVCNSDENYSGFPLAFVIIQCIVDKRYSYAIDETIKKWKISHSANKKDIIALTIIATLYHWKDISEAIDVTNDNNGKYVSYLKQVLKNNYDIADNEHIGRDIDIIGKEIRRPWNQL